jgi:hypothetical protein
MFINWDDKIGNFIALDAFFDPEIHGWVNTSTPVSFTYGFDLTVRYTTRLPLVSPPY